MITIILAFINSKYNTGYELLFVGTIAVDIIILLVIAGIFAK